MHITDENECKQYEKLVIVGLEEKELEEGTASSRGKSKRLSEDEGDAIALVCLKKTILLRLILRF